MPGGVPGDLQGLPGGRQGQQVGGGRQDAAEGADGVMGGGLEREVEPETETILERSLWRRLEE